MSTEWTEAEIAAWVDGQLDGSEAERIARLVSVDHEAAAYAEAVRNTNQALKAAFEDPMTEPVPAPIRIAIESHPVGRARPFGAGRPGLVRRKGWRPAAVAASIALVIGLATGLGGGVLLRAPEHSERIVAATGMTRSGGPLHTALETLPSGSVSDNGVRPMLTFRDAEGRPCREFELVDAQPQELHLGIACRTADGAWHIDILVAAPPAGDMPATGFAPAAGAAGDALGAMLDALGAGPPLTPQEEDRLLEEGWRP